VASEPFGNDILVNDLNFAAGTQTNVALALLDRGFVAVWQSDSDDGSGWSVRMQRFQGQGLEPPPLLVDAEAGAVSSTDRIYSTVAEAVAAAAESDVIVIRAGPTPCRRQWRSRWMTSSSATLRARWW
jgi:hypothetical protein